MYKKVTFRLTKKADDLIINCPFAISQNRTKKHRDSTFKVKDRCLDIVYKHLSSGAIRSIAGGCFLLSILSVIGGRKLGTKLSFIVYHRASKTPFTFYHTMIATKCDSYLITRRIAIEYDP